jgi:hypothetical protein
MDESDAMSVRPRARNAVDQLKAGGVQAGEVSLQIVGAVGDVVQARAPAAEKSPHRGIRSEGLEKLHGADERNADSLGLQGFRGRAGLAGEELEDVGALGDGVDGDAHMVEGSVHP